MSEDCCSCLNSCSSLDSLCHIDRISNTLCIDDNVVLLTTFLVRKNIFDQCFLIIVLFLWHENLLCSIGDTTPQCKISCITSHNLDHTASFMRCRCITNLIDCFHCCINSCIKSDRVVCTCDIKVDCSWNTNCIYTKVCQFLSSCERTVSTDYYQSVDSVLLTDRSCLLLTFFCTHCLTTSCLENCTTTLNDIRHVTC